MPSGSRSIFPLERREDGGPGNPCMWHETEAREMKDYGIVMRDSLPGRILALLPTGHLTLGKFLPHFLLCD